MSSSPPTKPPRGVKQGRETSGLLMSVIRTLSASETNEQREKERAKLEKEYKKSDARLDELVAAHAQDIMDVMQKFNQVSNGLMSWGQHCDSAVARLTACRSLLQLRRDDLKRLWALARTHHYAAKMLSDISCVVESEREVREFAMSGRVLAAAHTLRAATVTAAPLQHVHALNTTREHLQAKKRELVSIIVRRISDAVYREQSAFTRHMSVHRRTALLLSELTKSDELTDAFLQDITPEYEASLTEEDKTFETTIMICLEALGVLEQLKEATEQFKVQIQNELLEVIESVSRRIIETADVDNECEQDADIPDNESASESGRPLARLVACLADEFRACGSRNKRLLQLWRAALQKHGVSDSCLHTEQHYWSAVQQVLQLLLTEYLDIESVNLAAQRASITVEAPSSLKITDYFAKKRPQRRRPKLFTLATCVGTVPGSTVARSRSTLVCKPHPSHLYSVLPTIHQLCASINNGGECSLRAFISDYIRSGEAARLAARARAQVQRAAAHWRERALLHAKEKRVVFSCCVSAWEAVRQVAAAASRCGPHAAHHALPAVSAGLAALAAASSAALNTVAPHATTGGAVSSRAAKWLADDDIVRFLQSLPNWRAVLSPTNNEDLQELNQAYEREAEILGSSLGDGALTSKEIVSDVKVLSDIAVFIESMAWISSNTRSIPSLVGGSSGVKVTDKVAADLAAAADIFDDLANRCLLFLHLESRIQCFYYVGGAEQDEEDEGDAWGRGGASGGAGAAGGAAAGGAGALLHALLAFHEHAAMLLAPHRRAYVVNGLGEMMSAGVMWRWSGAAGAAGAAGAGAAGAGAAAAAGAAGAAAGSARLAALRHCAAALGLPPRSLHRAHAYLRLLTCPPQEIIQSIKEKGAQFSELEYLNAFKIIGERLGISESDMRPYLKQLSIALEQVGITV